MAQSAIRTDINLYLWEEATPAPSRPWNEWYRFIKFYLPGEKNCHFKLELSKCDDKTGPLLTKDGRETKEQDTAKTLFYLCLLYTSPSPRDS